VLALKLPSAPLPALPALPVKVPTRSGAPVGKSDERVEAKAASAKAKLEPVEAKVDDEHKPAERSAIIKVEAPAKHSQPSATAPEPPAQVASDAESVPSLRALVVATPMAGSDSESEPESGSEPLLSEPPSEPMLSGQRSVVPPQAAVEREVTSVAPSRGRRRLLKVGAWLGVAAAVTLYFSASQPGTRVDALSHNNAAPAMATPLEDSVPAEVSPARRALDTPNRANDPAAQPPLKAPAAGEPQTGDKKDATGTSAPYDAPMLGFARRWARNQALACHQGGRAGGTVEVVITFAPEGKVSHAVLHGEPIASAPVAGCIESYFKAMLIPPYDGAPFTIRETLTLR
jgi:hypothetical protein